MARLPLSTLSELAPLILPTFQERDGFIFRADHPPPASWPGSRSLTEAEQLHSHTHLTDLFECEIGTVHDPELNIERPDPNHPRHRLAWEMACVMAEAWMCRLQRQFPEYEFRVYASRLDDPIVRFHRVREGEAPYLDDDSVARGYGREDLRVFDTRSPARRTRPGAP